MKYLVALIAFGVAGFFAMKQMKPPEPPPAPPAPPPPVVIEATPVISEAEQQRVIKATDDQDANVRWEAMVFLDKAKSPRAYPILFEKLHKDQEIEVRVKVIRLLATRKGRDISQHLVWALKDVEPEVRVEALQALDQVGDYATASAITGVLQDQEERVRTTALKTLNSLQDKRAAEIAAEQARQEALRREAEEAARKARK